MCRCVSYRADRVLNTTPIFWVAVITYTSTHRKTLSNM